MNNGEPVLLGAGRYIQQENAVDSIGSEAKYLGNSAMIIGGETALRIAGERICKSLDTENVSYQIHKFHGHCTMNQIIAIAEKAKNCRADVIIGVGGGKALDTAKGVAHVLDKKIITVPTIPATCACYATQCVIYTDEGNTSQNLFLKHEINAVIADTGILKNSPARYLASGIGDALAKYPEITFTVTCLKDWKKTVLQTMALPVAKQNWDQYIKLGNQAYRDLQSKICSDTLEDVLCLNMALTGMASSLTSGGKQLAVAHSFYSSICDNFKQQQASFLHGELVSLGLSIQMGVNGSTEREIHHYKNFIKGLGLPVSLYDIGLEPSQKNLKTIYDYIVNDMKVDDEIIKSGLWNAMIQVK